MSRTRAIAVYAVGIFVLSALTAPWAFRAVHQHWPDIPFHRVFDRVLLIFALAGLWPALRALGLRSWRELGFPRTRDWWKQLAVAYAIGVASFVVGGALLIVVGERFFNASISPAQVLQFAATGAVVALIEETFFRGGLQGMLERRFGMIVALLISSAIYSIVHFLKPKGAEIAPDFVTWSSGFEYLNNVMKQSLRARGVLPGFITLFLAGLTLGWAFAKTRALYLSMGLHAGWVCTLKSYAVLTSGGRMIENPWMWPVLIAVWLFVAWWCRVHESSASMAQASR